MKTLTKIIKSNNDKLEYLAFELKNKMKCVVVSDPETHDSAAAMSVKCGSFEDPPKIEGLAHLLEHLLFMGSERFPSMGGYRSQITENGGDSNAYTELNETMYYFNIVNEKFDKSVDMFSDFFRKTLLLKEAIDSEIKAVHSEHDKNLGQDNWREFQLMRHIAQKESVFNGFATGNEKTLGIENIHTSLREFYHNKYSANIMNLVLYGKESVEELKTLAEKHFSEVENKNLKDFRYNSPEFKKAYKKEQMGQLIRFQTQSKVMKMKLVWQFDYKFEDYRSDPYRILSFIIGHESEGSLLSALKSENLAFALMSGSNEIADLQTNFEITISLTEQGWNDVNRVLFYIGSYIRMLFKSDEKSFFHVFEESKEMYKIKFDFQEKTGSISKATTIASRIGRIPEEECLIAPYLLEKFEYERYINILGQMTLENSLLLLLNDDFGKVLKDKEPIYGTNYEIEPISYKKRDSFAKYDESEDLKSYSIKFPPVNVFIPRKFELYPLEPLPEEMNKELNILENEAKIEENNKPVIQNRFPKVIFSNDFGKLFYKQDHLFRIPKIAYNLNIYLNLENGPNYHQNRIFLAIWSAILKEYLNEFNYLADMANLKVDLIPGRKVFGIRITGYSDSFKTFMPKFGEKLKSFLDSGKNNDQLQNLEKEFKNQKEKIIIGAEKKLKKEPYKLLVDSLEGVFIENLRNQVQDLEVLKKSEFNAFLSFHNKLFDHVYTEALINGNLSESEAIAMNTSLLNSFIFNDPSIVLRKDQLVNQLVIKIPEKKTIILTKDLINQSETSNAVMVIYQGNETFENRFFIMIIAKLIEAGFFEELRTNQKLGYVVTSFVDERKEIFNLTFLVQSKDKTPSQISKCVYDFLEQSRLFLMNIGEEEFNNVKSALITDYKHKNKTLAGETDFFFNLIFKQEKILDHKNRCIKIIEKISKQQVEAFANQFFFTNRRVIELHLCSLVSKEENESFLKERLVQDKSKTEHSGQNMLEEILVFKNEEDLKKALDFYHDRSNQLMMN